MNDRRREYVRVWLCKAGSDLKNAEIILAADEAAPPFDTVCFHCQQTAEKFLKAYLIHQEQPFPHSHNLADIVEACMQIDGDFASILRKAETLTPYAVEIRYPDDFYMPTREEAEESLGIAEEIRQFVLARIGMDDAVEEED